MQTDRNPLSPRLHLLHRGCGRLHKVCVGGRAMLDIIGINALVARPAVDDARDFLGQIVQILHHCPHAEAAGGRQLVGGVAGEKEPYYTQNSHQARRARPRG